MATQNSFFAQYLVANFGANLLKSENADMEVLYIQGNLSAWLIKIANNTMARIAAYDGKHKPKAFASSEATFSYIFQSYIPKNETDCEVLCRLCGIEQNVREKPQMITDSK